jgi:hypothetical protein
LLGLRIGKQIVCNRYRSLDLLEVADWVWEALQA